MAEVRLINNLKGILYYWNTPLLDFEIKDRQLVKAKDLNNGRLLPHELAVYGINYGNINEFFRNRTIQEGCMFYHEHLKALGMEHMDFDRYIHLNNGNNNLDNYWVKFEGYGAQRFEDFINSSSAHQ